MKTVCILCSSRKKAMLRDRVRYEIKRKVFKCGNCSMVYLEPKLPSMRRFYTEKTYRKKYGPVLGKASAAKAVFQMYAPYQGPIVAELRGVLRKNMKVLDVGCSAGQFLSALKGKVATRVGLELSADEVAFIRKHLDFPVYDEPIEEVHIEEGPFDLVTCLQTLEHVERPIPFLTHLGRNLKKGGYLYLELPNIDDVLLAEYKVKAYADFYFREPHLSYFSKKTLERALFAAGFKGQIKTIQRYSLLNHLHWIQTGKPQPDFKAGNEAPRLVPRPSDAASRALNKLIAKADAEYKTLVGRLGLGESLTFLGKKV